MVGGVHAADTYTPLVASALKMRIGDVEKASAKVLKTFKSLVVGMIWARCANGYREAVAHFQSEMKVFVTVTEPDHDAPVLA